jgi:hypothetical protein
MIVLNLKDPNQIRINSRCMVQVKDRHVVFNNFGIESQYRVIGGIVGGSYWIDRDNRSVQLLLQNHFGAIFTNEIVLGDLFFELFPEAKDWWGDYFFRLHYAG